MQADFKRRINKVTKTRRPKLGLPVDTDDTDFHGLILDGAAVNAPQSRRFAPVGAFVGRASVWIALTSAPL
jgi:hypothetical protein